MKQSFLQSPIGRLRIIAFLEGVSFLVLLFIAMPLKYYFDSPLMVRVIGMAHGVLFLIYIFALIDVKISRQWPLLKTLWAFMASLMPFGTFMLDSNVLKKEMEQEKS